MGIGWTLEQQQVIENIPIFNLNMCQRDIKIWFSDEEQYAFPRLISDFTATDSDDDNVAETLQTRFADFAILNQGSETFQIVNLSMKFDYVDYNWFSGGQNYMNEEFVNALESRVERLYKESWICQYFDYEPKCENNIVFLWHRAKKSVVDSYRFQIIEFIPEKSQPYFLPYYDLSKYRSENEAFFASTSLLSNVPHGFKAKYYPSTKSLFYNAPYFLIFKTSPSVNSNYLVFNSFLKPNSDCCILAMLVYNELDNTFSAQFSPAITLPYLHSLSLNNILEFNLFDTDSKQVELSDFSQLFVSLTTL